MSGTFENVITGFITGMSDKEEGAISTTGTLKIRENQLIHYRTPIAERTDDVRCMVFEKYYHIY